MSYESPIRVFIDDMVDDLTTALENGLPEAVLSYGIAVDKAELIKALDYDRDQYDKGYTDGQIDATKHGKWGEKIVECDNPYLKRRFYCSVCGDWNTYGKTRFCPNCGAKMDEEADE